MAFSILHHLEDAVSALLHAFFVTLSQDELLNVDFPELKPANTIKDFATLCNVF